MKESYRTKYRNEAIDSLNALWFFGMPVLKNGYGNNGVIVNTDIVRTSAAADATSSDFSSVTGIEFFPTRPSNSLEHATQASSDDITSLDLRHTSRQ
jgi:hypothetical protein